MKARLGVVAVLLTTVLVCVALAGVPAAGTYDEFNTDGSPTDNAYELTYTVELPGVVIGTWRKLWTKFSPPSEIEHGDFTGNELDGLLLWTDELPPPGDKEITGPNEDGSYTLTDHAFDPPRVTRLVKRP